MNFFAFDSSVNRLTIGNNFWVFLATWVPLTLITIAGYAVVVYRRKHRGKYRPNSDPESAIGDIRQVTFQERYKET